MVHVRRAMVLVSSSLSLATGNAPTHATHAMEMVFVRSAPDLAKSRTTTPTNCRISPDHNSYALIAANID